MKRIVVCLMAVFMMTALANSLRADLTPEQTKQAQALIEQFKDPEFAVRQKAVEELIKMGPGVLPQVRKALAETKDNEVKLRCEMVIKGIMDRQDADRETGVGARKLIERRLRELPPPYQPPAAFGGEPGPGGMLIIVYSLNGEGWAYTMSRNGRSVVVHNGRVGDEYDQLAHHLQLSPDGTRVAYGAKRADKGHLVCDGLEGPAYDRIAWYRFSPDSKSLAYTALSGKEYILVRDGKELARYSRIGGMMFSPDSRHLAFMAEQDGKSFIVLDGLRGASYEHMNLPLTGRELRYIAGDGQENWLIEMDWPERKAATQADLVERKVRRLTDTPPEPPTSRESFVSSSLLNFGFKVKREGKWFVLINDRTEGPYDEITGQPTFSANDKHIAYGVKIGGECFLVWDGKRFPAHDEVSGMRFSPDGEHLACGVKKGEKRLVLWDGKEGPAYDGVTDVVFSPDGKHLAYVVRQGNRCYVIRDGRESRSYSTPPGQLVFSPDGSHLACAGFRDGYQFIVCDEKEGRPYARAGELGFSRDGKHLFYEASDGKHQFMVCDVIEGPLHSEVSQYRGEVRAQQIERALRYFAVDGQHRYLVEVDWPEDTDWTNGLKPVEP